MGSARKSNAGSAMGSAVKGPARSLADPEKPEKKKKSPKRETFAMMNERRGRDPLLDMYAEPLPTFSPVLEYRARPHRYSPSPGYHPPPLPGAPQPEEKFNLSARLTVEDPKSASLLV